MMKSYVISQYYTQFKRLIIIEIYIIHKCAIQLFIIKYNYENIMLQKLSSCNMRNRENL